MNGPQRPPRRREVDEVDVILEDEDGSLVGIEVRAAARVPGALRKLRTATGDLFHASIVLHLGRRSYTYEDRLHVMAIDPTLDLNPDTAPGPPGFGRQCRCPVVRDGH